MTNTFYNNAELVQKAKEVSIVKLLQSVGVEPVKEIGKELLYYSPLRTEKTPSFFVNPSKNRFNDFGGSDDMKGDCIRLAQLLHECSFLEAVDRLLALERVELPSFSFSGLRAKETANKNFEVVHTCKLRNPALIEYVESRGITLDIADIYIREVTYRYKGRTFFAVGFENDNGGYELRNGLGFKGGKTANGITTFERGSQSAALFEGFFDFLSALKYYGRLSPTITTIVLNSCNNLKRALPLLTNRLVVNCFLDNDKTGDTTLERLEKEGIECKNWSKELYPTCKDFNDFLIQSHNKVVTNGPLLKK
ncbi:toprim domain-containing protein [Telluribacter sp. SYSU D00476]|uniref:toprim domain-containing protein n=1 Tax=Telluribacter sp. SYSU D00476 TaxID=2811430 RepID=UPI001FF1A117|nr:toprim domain-containing protein [Telluribacter sp. SYSU D00476]